MTERETGHYWVRVSDGPQEVALWEDGKWWLPGVDFWFRPSDVTVLSPCLALPNGGEVQALAEAMWQLLDDMGPSGLAVCPAAKAQARVAFEPWRSPDMPLDTSVEDARELLRSAEHGSRGRKGETPDADTAWVLNAGAKA